MKKWIITLVLSVFTTGAQAGASAPNCAQDTMLRSAADQADLGGATSAYFRQSGARVIMEFDLSGISLPVTNAVLKIRQSSNVSGTYNVQAFPMVYTTNNYLWIQGTGTSANGSNTSSPADATSAASYKYRCNGTTDLPWENSSGTALTNAGTAELWGAQIGQVQGTDWTGGNYSSIILDAATVETYRTTCGKITIGLWDDAQLGQAANYQISTSEALNEENRPALEIQTSAPARAVRGIYIYRK
ncbi:MAG: hypothetical protein WC334_01665 [Kiritimatiellales bacterium]